MPIFGRTRLLAILAVATAIGTSLANADEMEAQSLQLETAAAKTGDQLRDIVARAYAVSPQVKARLKAL